MMHRRHALSICEAHACRARRLFRPLPPCRPHPENQGRTLPPRFVGGMCPRSINDPLTLTARRTHRPTCPGRLGLRYSTRLSATSKPLYKPQGVLRCSDGLCLFSWGWRCFSAVAARAAMTAPSSSRGRLMSDVSGIGRHRMSNMDHPRSKTVPFQRRPSNRGDFPSAGL